MDGDIAQGNRLLIGIETIRLEILRMGILVDVDGLLRAGLHEFPVLFGHVHLCAGQLFHDSCGSTVIKVRVADEDLFDLLRTIAQAVDGIHQHVSTLRDCRVDEDQPVPCVMYHKEYAAELLKAAGKWPDMTVFTTDYVITKGGKTITGDRLLWVKRILRLPLRCPAFNGFTWVKRLPLMLGNSICCPATTYHKSLLGEPLVRSEYSYALDWDNLVQLAERPGRFICREKPLMYYRVHDGAATKACMEDNRRAKEEREMFARFWPEPVVRFLMRGYASAYKEYE